MTIHFIHARFLILINKCMSGKKSKDKGKGYENEVSKFLTHIYNQPFLRVPGSGALIGGQNAYRKTVMTEGQIRSFKGDIIPPDNWNNFHCEAKFYKDFPFHQLFTGECKQIDEWVEQVKIADEDNDFNIILMKFNYKGQWVMVEQKHGFKIENSLNYKDWVFSSWDKFWTERNTNFVRELSTIDYL